MVSTHRSQLSLRRGGKQRPGPLVVNGANNRLQTSLGKPSITRREPFPALPKGTLGTLLLDFGPRQWAFSLTVPASLLARADQVPAATVGNMREPPGLDVMCRN